MRHLVQQDRVQPLAEIACVTNVTIERNESLRDLVADLDQAETRAAYIHQLWRALATEPLLGET